MNIMAALAFRVLLQYLDLNDIYSLKNFLDSNSFQVDDRDDNGATILMHAATRGVTSFVKVSLPHTSLFCVYPSLIDFLVSRN